ncbi:MAG TPA: SGNH/GDSL hydrolase family protein [Chitinispirillaceae bacterium]|nr:SGNH/GDSL hydrolase family protein [Chitinispirillaceae bacterium]
MIELKKILILFCAMAAICNSTNLISADNPYIQYFGRFDHSNRSEVAFEWPGVYIKATFQGTSCKTVLKGNDLFDAFIDNQFVTIIKSGSQSDTLVVAKELQDKTHQLLLSKRTESSSPSFFKGLILDSGKTLLAPPAPETRKIEFIGDSYTAGFANEYNSRECPADKADSIVINFTNTNKAFGPICARSFNAQYQINAISGRGLVRNYNGTDPGKELPYYYEKLLLSVKEKKWDFTRWKADVVVIGIGINDFQADPPYADSVLFDTQYEKTLTLLRKNYPGVKFICCATKVWPTDALIPRIKSIVKSQKKKGHKDLWYFEYTTENNALYGHPGIKDHQIIAKGLEKVIAEATGWKIVNN